MVMKMVIPFLKGKSLMVGRQSREDDYQSRMGKGVNHSVNVGTDNHMVLQHFLVAFQRKAVGPEEKAALLDLRSQ